METMLRLTWSDLAYLLPEISLVIAAILLTLIDLAMPNRLSRQVIGWLSLTGILVSLGFVVWAMMDLQVLVNGAPKEAIELLNHSYRIDDFASLMKILFLVGAGLIVLMSIGVTGRDPELKDKGEFYTLILPAVLGAMIMVSSGDLITIFVGMELLSITTYVLVGMRKNTTLGAEAGFKYVVIGGISSAFILFGMSYLYGVSGSTNLGVIREAMAVAVVDYKAFVYIGFFFMLGGLAMKIAAAPFHAWAPDVYQGAATPVSAFLAVISKAAALAVLFRIYYNTALQDTKLFTGGQEGTVGEDVFFAMKVLAVTAMIVGTTAALRQRNMKRLLALSGVANAGYLLVPLGASVAAYYSNNMSELLYYLIAYLFMNIGAFAVLAIVAKAAGNDEMKSFAGLYYRAPWTAGAMVVLVLSLAGLPITGGFFGKLFIIFGAAQMRDYWVVAIMLATSVISYYFYFAIIRQMFMRSSDGGAEIKVPFSTGLAIWICVACTLLLGIMPTPVLEWINSIFSIPFDLYILLQ